MSGRTVVRFAPAFAGGLLKNYNRVLLAAARGGSFDSVEVVIDESLADDQDLVLRVLNARGDPVGLPAPHRGILRDESERALWAAALLDVLPETLAGSAAVERFLPPPGASPADAAAKLWTNLLPGTSIRVHRSDEEAQTVDGDGEAADDPELVWVGAHQRKALAELGVSAEAIACAEEDAAARYRPTLHGELADATEKLRASVGGPLAELRTLAREVDPALLGAWSRLERSVRRGVEEFVGAAERCLDNHSGIRRTRWRAVSQALRPAERSQEEGMSLLAAVALFGLQPERSNDYVATLRIHTSDIACIKGRALFLDC